MLSYSAVNAEVAGYLGSASIGELVGGGLLVAGETALLVGAVFEGVVFVASVVGTMVE
jgi:hypothetical protein